MIIGTNTTLQNVTVTGNVYINPGANGDVTLQGVTVHGKIIVESGATHTVRLVNSKATTLSVESSSPVRVLTQGTTSIQQTVVTSNDLQAVTFENDGGDLGALVVQAGQSITLSGSVPFQSVVVEGSAKVTVAAGTSVNNLTVNSSNADITVSPSAVVSTLAIQSGTGVKITDDGTVQTVDNQSVSNQVTIGGSGSVSDYKGSKVTGSTTNTDSGSSTGSGSSDTSGFSGTSTGTADNGGSTSITQVVYGIPPTGTTLAVPQSVYFQGQTITWNPVADATGYSITLVDQAGNPTTTSSISSAPFFNLAELGLTTGQYTVTVQATGLDSQYTSSGQSTPVTASVYQLPTPTNLQVSPNNPTVLTWGNVENADQYSVMVFTYSPIASQSYQYAGSDVVTEPTIDLSKLGLQAGSYVPTVTAMSSDGNYSWSLPSEYSPVVNLSTVTQSVYLPAPQGLTVNNGLITFNPVPNAVNYDVQYIPAGQMNPALDDTFPATTSSTQQWAISNDQLPTGQYTISVRADGTESYQDSPYTVSQSVYVNQPEAPSDVVLSSTNGLSWSSVTGASQYVVTLTDANGNMMDLSPVSGTSIDASTLASGLQGLGLDSGWYTVTVEAIAVGDSRSLSSTAGKIYVSDN